MNRGATLLEVAISMTLIALLGGAASLALPDLSRPDQLKQAVSNLSHNLKFLASQAKFKELDFELDLERNSYRTIPINLLSHQFPPGITILRPHRLLRFNSNGTISPASIVLTQHGNQCSVVISLRGRVRSVC